MPCYGHAGTGRQEGTTLGAHHPQVSGGLFELAVLNANDAILVAQIPPDRGGGPIVTFVNPGFTALTLYRPDEVIGRSVRLLHGPKTDRAVIDRTWNALIRGESARFETINYRKDGSEFWNDVSITPIADASGRYSQLISIRRDTSERHAFEDSLRAHEASFRQLFDHNPIPMWVFDRETRRFLEVNQAALDQYGYTRERFLAMTIDEIRPPAERPRLRATFDPGALPERRFGRWRHLRCDGSEIVVEIIAHHTYFRGNDVALVAAIDVTEQEHSHAELTASELRLRRSEEHLGRAQRIARIGSWQCDAHGTFIWSPETYRIFGLPEGTGVLHRDVIRPRIHVEDREQATRTIDALFTGERSHDPGLDYRIVRPDGAIRVVHREGEVITDATGAVIGAIGTVQDVTERRQAETARRELEAQLVQSQKMEALGRLAGGMAHDLNNTLVPILSLTKLVMKRLPPESQDHANIVNVYRAGTRARDLVRRVLAFSRKQPLRMESVDLAAIAGDTLAMLRASLPPSIAMRCDIAAVPPVPGDASQLAQLIMNLVTNAAQAIGSRPGTIELSLRREEAIAGTAASPHLHLAVSDTGYGMDAAVMARIFEPFFTTKPVNEGTGLGLSIVHGIVTSHGGRVTVASVPGEGTTFDIRLPLPAESVPLPDLESAT